MIRRIHGGAHLPSVLGVGTDASGAHDYAVDPRPLRYVGYGAHVLDYSCVGFAVMPGASVAYLLSCHGDPDGAGALAAPAQGDRHAIATRRACGSCHDDVDWSRPYTANGFTMPAQTDDTTCAVCVCHDSDAAAAHVNLETSLGVEACATCHGPDREFSAEVSHQVE